MYFIQGENMATKNKNNKSASVSADKFFEKTLHTFENKYPKTALDLWWKTHRDAILGAHDYRTMQPDLPKLQEELEKEFKESTHLALIPLLTNHEIQFTGDIQKAQNATLKYLDTQFTATEIHTMANLLANSIALTYQIELEAAKVIKGKLPKGISINLAADLKKPIQPPTVEVKIPVPEPRIPLDPKIPIPYPKTPLDPKIPLPDPKIPIPKPEIKIHGPYVIKDLEIKLAEVERIRKSLPKNATKAEKKAAANAEQQIKNLLKAAKRAEPKATKKAVVKKATVKKATKKKK